jgi:tRNA G18 (ribose-2'-O)-methylase SpoU
MANSDERGYFGIGIFQAKTGANVGTLWRTAYILGAKFIFTIGSRYKLQSSDTLNTPKHIPLFRHETVEQFYEALPYDAPLVGVELPEDMPGYVGKSSTPLFQFNHPERAVYILGSEDGGLPPSVLERCHRLVYIPYDHPSSMNVATVGAIVMYDRMTKQQQQQKVMAARG